MMNNEQPVKHDGHVWEPFYDVIDDQPIGRWVCSECGWPIGKHGCGCD